MLDGHAGAWKLAGGILSKQRDRSLYSPGDLWIEFA